MNGPGWADCPPAARAQLAALIDGLSTILAGTLAGVYLHGSLALGCFEPGSSDLDILVVTDEPLRRARRAAVTVLCLDMSGRSGSSHRFPVELTILTRAQLDPWRHPCAFEFHYSERWRGSFERGALRKGGVDADLAAHVTVARHAGVVLSGLPREQALPEVPGADYVDSLLRDFAWCRREGVAFARYAILSMAREWATLATGVLHSKESGAVWAAERLPRELAGLVERALVNYRGGAERFDIDEFGFRRFTRAVDRGLTSALRRSAHAD